VTTLSYNESNDDLKVSLVTDPFGRSASFGYDSTTGHLASITDVLNITSNFTYLTVNGTVTDFISSLTTWYGTTNFTYGDSSTGLDSTRFVKNRRPYCRRRRPEVSVHV
jgi:hypothetical protein